MTTTYTADDLRTLEQAIAQGAVRVKYVDKEIEYRSLKEMMIIRDNIRRALGMAQPDSGRKFASFSKGLGE
jgi:hypothetical protein